MPSTLSQKRTFRASLERIHGHHWNGDLTPSYDDRGMASIAVTQIVPSELNHLVHYPTATLHFYPQFGDRPENIAAAIHAFLSELGPELEHLDFHNTQTSERRTNTLRSIMPSDATVFSQLPNLKTVNFRFVDVPDRVVIALCKNPSLYNFGATEGTFTKRVVASVAAHETLRIFNLKSCHHFPNSYEQVLKKRLANVEIVRLKD